jgi:hypothetical protein
MFNFAPDKSNDNPQEVPYFEDVKASEGWQGQSTQKDITTLKGEISTSIARLGGLVSGFERGKFGNRQGYRIHYVMEVPNNKSIQGYIDIACLPIRPLANPYRRGSSKTEERREDQSLRMALYNIAEALKALNIMAKLSPGYMPLMPWMIVNKDGLNLTQTYALHSNLKTLMPPTEEFIDAKIKVMDTGDNG